MKSRSIFETQIDSKCASGSSRDPFNAHFVTSNQIFCENSHIMNVIKDVHCKKNGVLMEDFNVWGHQITSKTSIKISNLSLR